MANGGRGRDPARPERQRPAWGVVVAVVAVTVAAGFLAGLLVSRALGPDRRSDSATSALPSPATSPPEATPTPGLPTPSESEPSPSASGPPAGALAGALLRLPDLTAVPAQAETAWEGAKGWASAARTHATWACAQTLPGAASAAFEDRTFAEHRDTLDQEALVLSDPGAAHAALVAVRTRVASCAGSRPGVDVYATFDVTGAADEAVVLSLQVPGQPPTFAPGDSGTHLVDLYVVRSGAAVVLAGYGHYNQDVPRPSTNLAAAVASRLCAASGHPCRPAPRLRQTSGQPLGG